MSRLHLAVLLAGLAAAPAAGAFALARQEPAPPAPREPQPGEAQAEPEAQPVEEPAPPPEGELSLRDLLAAERAAEVAAAGDLPFGLRARPLRGLPANMAAIILTGRSGGQVVVAPLALPLVLPAGGGAAAAAVPILVEVDGPSLLGPTPPERPEVGLYAYAVTETGEVRAFFSQSLALDLEEVGEAVFVGGLKVFGHLELPPGRYSLRVLVHVPGAQRYGLAVQPLEVPDGAALLAPLAEEPEAPWLLVAEAPHGEAARGELAAADGGLRFGELFRRAGTPVPSALPVFHGEAAELDLLLYGAAGAPEPAQLEARLGEPGGGGEAVRLPANVVGREATDLPGFDRLRVSLPFGELPTGSYELSFTAPAIGGRELTSPALPVVVLRGESSATLWTDVQRQIAGGDAPRPAALDLEGSDARRWERQGRVRRAVGDAYRAVLARLARGDREGALADLARIEKEVVETVANLPFELLHEAETGVLSGLAALDPEALLPVVPFSMAAYDRHRDALDYGLATHSRRIAESTAALFAAGSTAEGSAALAAGALAQLGAELQTAHVLVAAQALLERALVLDPANRFALLNLAAGREKTADYAGTVALLRRLVELDPKSPEGRVRLAINLLRLGETAEGTAILGRVIAENNPPWVLTLAYEELAAHHLAAGRAGEAAALLGQAAGRLPEQSRLVVQLAYALERAGRTTEAARAIQRLGPGDGASPRHQYNRWPVEERQEISQRIAEAAMVRLPSLGAALERLPGGADGARR